jgi:hypothetical protein
MKWTRNLVYVGQMKDACKGEDLVYKFVRLKKRRNLIAITETGCKLYKTGSG